MSPVVTFLVILSVLVNVALAAGFVIIGLQQGQTSVTIRANQITQCQEGNITRLQDIRIWNRLLALPPAAKPAARKEAAELAALVKAKDTPKNCTAIYAASSH